MEILKKKSPFLTSHLTCVLVNLTFVCEFFFWMSLNTSSIISFTRSVLNVFHFEILEESVGERLTVGVRSVQLGQIRSAAEYDRPGRVLNHVTIVKLEVVHKELVQMSRRQYNDGDSGVSLGGVQQLLVPFQSNSHCRRHRRFFPLHRLGHVITPLPGVGVVNYRNTRIGHFENSIRPRKEISADPMRIIST